MAHTPPAETSAPPAPATKKDRTHWLYIAVIASVVLGAAVGLLFPEFGKSLKPLGDGFVSLIKMMIGPVIFCTIALGVGSIAKAATVGRVGGIALVYFMAMSTFALAIGLVVGNLIHPGEGLKLTPYDPNKPQAAVDGTVQFLLDIIPGSLPVLPTLFIALLVGFALQQMGPAGAPLLRGLTLIQGVVFRILMMVMWVAPIGAFGAIAAVVGSTGWSAIGAMALLMGAFYLTCIAFIVVVLGTVLKVVTGLSILSLMKYLGREYLLIFATSSSETALPRLIAKMEHAGVDKSVVGVTVPTGYSFNLDGTAIYLTMAALFVSNAMGAEMNLGEQIGLLVFMIIASKGAAGVTGAIRDLYVKQGGPTGKLGFPLMSELSVGGPTAGSVAGAYNDFQNGSIVWSPEYGAHVVSGKIKDQWVKGGGAFGMGYPKGDVKNGAQEFTKGGVLKG